LFDFIRKRVRTEEDAEDILQDVLYQLVASYSVAEPIEKLAAWLFTVARNRITDWYRKKRHLSLTYDENEELLPLNLDDVLQDPAGTPENVYFRSLIREELEDALQELPVKQREVFVMHEVEGRSFNEIAELTGEPLNTLLSRKRYAVLFLRERLQDLYNDFISE
jgi:RNA polymerase sigma factor (sigma-70 family)